MPAYVASKMTSIKKGSFFVPFPEDYVNSAMATIGLDASTFGYGPHWLVMTFYQAVYSLSPHLFTYLILKFAIWRRAMKVAQLEHEKQQ